MFGVLAVIEILYYCGLSITDPAHLATLLGSMQTNIIFCGQIFSLNSPFSGDLWPW